MPVRAFVFDAYGTLFDVHAAIARHRAAAGPDADRFSEIWRIKQLEYAWMLSAAGHYVDFWTLTERALDHAFARFPTVDRTLRATLLDAYFQLDAFPDARAALGALKAKGVRTAILSNGSPKMLDGAVAAARIGADLDAVLSVDAIRIYKPRREVYALVTDAFAIAPAEVAFVSSNRWDVMGAAAFGFRCIWVNRAEHAGRVSGVRAGRGGARPREPGDAGALGGTCNVALSEAIPPQRPDQVGGKPSDNALVGSAFRSSEARWLVIVRSSSSRRGLVPRPSAECSRSRRARYSPAPECCCATRPGWREGRP